MIPEVNAMQGGQPKGVTWSPPGSGVTQGLGQRSSTGQGQRSLRGPNDPRILGNARWVNQEQGSLKV